MIIRKANLPISNTNPAIGQKVIIIKNNNGTFALPIGYNSSPYNYISFQKFNSTLNFNIPTKKQNDYIILIVQLTTDETFSQNNYFYILMTDSNHRSCMKIFTNGNFQSVQSPYLNYSYFGKAITLNLNQEILHNYFPGTKYNARYTWINQNGDQDDWLGFQFTADMSTIGSSNGITNTIVPSQTFPTITLPIPYDENNDNLTLIVDIGLDGQFIEMAGSQASTLEGGYYFRISIKNSYQRQLMKVFQTDHFEDVPNSGINISNYDSTVSLTINTTMFPFYQFGTTYYARYTWTDSNESHMDWKGFKFSSDIASFAYPQLRNIQTIRAMQEKLDELQRIVLNLQGNSLNSNSSTSSINIITVTNDKYYRYVNIDDNMYDGDYYPTQVTHDGQVVYQQQDGNFYMIFMYNSYMSNYLWCIVQLSDYEDIIGGKTYADYVDSVGDVPGNKSTMTDNTSATPADVIWGNGDYSCTQMQGGV